MSCPILCYLSCRIFASTTRDMEGKQNKNLVLTDFQQHSNLYSTMIAEEPMNRSVEILRVIKDAQQQHGLRHGDFQRYRGYCTRRIRRLRKTLKMQQGDKRHFKKRDISIADVSCNGIDDRIVHIPLMLAERAWAYAMQLRQEANTESRKKFHLVSKLRKACIYTLQLQTLCNMDNINARTKLEVEAYVAWMHGTLHFELSLWKTAAESFKKSQVIYENLAEALPEQEGDIYKLKVEELIPSLRYCAYNIEDSTSIDDLLELRARGLLDNLDMLVAQTKTQSSEALQSSEWRGKPFSVRPQRVRLFLLSLQELDKSLEKATTEYAKIEIFENILMDCKDAISAVKDEIKQDTKLRASMTGGQASFGIQYLLSYLQYIRLIHTIQRNLCLVEQAKHNLNDFKEKIEGKRTRPQDLTRLYEIILQNISEMMQINGMEEDDVYQNEIEKICVSFKAFRCYYIALILVEMKRWREAVAMYERSKKYAFDALKTTQLLFNLGEELKKLILTIDSCKFSAHAYSVLKNDDIGDSILDVRSQKSSKPLFERLSLYKEDQSLHTKHPTVYKITPEMETIQCKPLFFDLSLNFIEFPSLDGKLESQDTKKHGISGFVKGFLGWGGNK